MNIRINLMVLIIIFPFFSLAQHDEASQAQENASLPEEVIVVGDRFLLRTQMFEAEKLAYDTFNEFNDEKRFNISCSMHQPTGTHIQRQVCLAAFEGEASAAHGRAWFEDYRAFLDRQVFGPTWNPSPQVTHQPVESEIARQLPEYKAKLKQVAEDHPEFLEAIILYSEIRNRYQEATTTRIYGD